MKILVIGTGGREHALVWKISQSDRVEKIFCPGGNAGIAKLADTTPVDPGENFSGYIELAKNENIELTIVGPEAPLAAGIVDAFQEAGLRIFGPNRDAARIESSKCFAKEIMLEAGVPTGSSQVFHNSSDALAYLENQSIPIVIKADGLAAGKGVIVAHTMQEAGEAVRALLDDKKLGNAGDKVIIEEFLEGEEASLLAFTDGKTVTPMESSQDHKAIGEGDTGPNTGGMGAYSPAPVLDAAMQKRCLEDIMQPVINALNKRGIQYKGVLYAGLMISPKGPRVLEFNCRFGDPEIQAIIPRMENDLIEIIDKVIDERLSEVKLRWKSKPAVCVVLASEGYPVKYEKGKVIEGLDQVKEEQIIFHAGTKLTNGNTITNGGRVLGVTALGDNLENAIEKAYKMVDQIGFDGKYFRRDIGQKALKRMEK